MKSVLKQLGLLLFSSIFLVGGWGQATEPTGRADQARALGLPVSDAVVQASGWAMIVGGLALQFKSFRRIAALLLALQLIPVTYIGHRFWAHEPGPMRNNHRIQFFKNLSLIGAALALAAGE